MKIYEKTPWEHRITCTKCLSVLGVEAADVKFFYAGDHGGDREPYWYVCCAVCGEQIELYWDVMPERVRENAKAAYLQK